jgi:hypothetical protein
MAKTEQKFEMGQKFQGTYPPEAAAWCAENEATIVIRDSGEFEIVPIPMATEEEMKAARLIEIETNLASTDRLMLEECVSRMLEPKHPLNFHLLDYRAKLQYFTETEGWWKLPVCTWEEWRDAQEKADAKLRQLFTQKEEKDANQES